MSQSEVARRIGVSKQSVCRWAAALRDRGTLGLRRSPRAGRRPRLDAEQHALTLRVLKKRLEPLTLERVNQLLERHTGTTYRRTRLIALLREAGFRFRRGVGWISPINWLG